MRWIKGTALTTAQQAYVLARYVHRYTGDHRPEWSRKPWKDGKPYPLQFASDAEWLAHTEFAVNDDGRLSARCTYCRSNPTWPRNPELREPQTMVGDTARGHGAFLRGNGG